MKKIKYKFSPIIFICVMLLGFLTYKLIKRDSQFTNVEKIIKKHNAVRESSKNLTYPTISKPASSQIGMIGGDSVRVSKNN